MTGFENAVPGNMALFQVLTANTNSPALLILLAKALAVLGPVIALAIAAMVFFRGGVQHRHVTALASAAMVIGLCVNLTIALITYVPRPFEIGLGLNLLQHAPETSFPSDHATLIWSLGFGLLCLGQIYWAGALIIFLGAATAWARIYLGAHFPLDMAGSLVISAIASSFVLLTRPQLSRVLLPMIDYGHNLTMRRLASLFNRTRNTH